MQPEQIRAGQRVQIGIKLMYCLSAGPMLPEERLIRDILPSLWVQLTVKLSLFHPKGKTRAMLRHQAPYPSLAWRS